jgi:histidyl-tRNA synthetase
MAPRSNKQKGGKKKDAKASLFQSVPGMADIFPSDAGVWRALRDAAEAVAELHDFRRIETPVVEPLANIESALGSATLGDTSLYLVKVKGQRLALRAESTVGTLRSYLEHHLGYVASPFKAWTETPIFRWTPARANQPHLSHEFAFSVIGDSDPVYDIETILVLFEFLRELKFKDLKLSVNTLGCRVCRSNYKEKLKAYYQSRRSKLCRQCAGWSDRNPWHVFSCETPACREMRAEAPIVLDYLCQNCNNHFKAVLELIEESGIIYEPNPYLLADTDYYNRLAFEISVAGFPKAIASGGRFDYLSEALHGRMIPAVGGAIRVEATLAALKALNIQPRMKEKPRVFFIAVGEQAKKVGVRLIGELRGSGIAVSEVFGKKSIKAQLKVAEKIRSPLVLLVGQKEAFEGTVIARDMRTGAQETVVAISLVEEVRRRLK